MSRIRSGGQMLRKDHGLTRSTAMCHNETERQGLLSSISRAHSLPQSSCPRRPRPRRGATQQRGRLVGPPVATARTDRAGLHDDARRHHTRTFFLLKLQHKDIYLFFSAPFIARREGRGSTYLGTALEEFTPWHSFKRLAILFMWDLEWEWVERGSWLTPCTGNIHLIGWTVASLGFA